MTKTFADLTKDQQAEIRGGEALGELIKMPQWAFFQKILEAHLEQNRRALEGPPPDPSKDGFAQAMRNEHLKGTIIGLRLALSLPSVTMDAAKALRMQLLGSDEATAP